VIQQNSIQYTEMESTQNSSNILATLSKPNDGDLSSLTHAIVEWRRLQEELTGLRQQARENGKRARALEEIILRVMKNHNIGALDLKNSGGRILFKKQKRQAGLGAKNLHKYLAEYLKSDQEAAKVLTYINEHREVVTKESIQYENL